MDRETTTRTISSTVT